MLFDRVIAASGVFFLALLVGSIGLIAWIWRVAFRLPKLQPGTVAFFHPFADGGGGGERVLW